MVFLASGEDPNFGLYSNNVRRALRSIISQQNAGTGYLGHSMYHHGFAMLALAEAYGTVDDRNLWTESERNHRSIGVALELAVRGAITSQKKNSFGGWRYSPDSNDADTSVSGAVMVGLLAARNAGIEIPDEAIDRAIKYYVQMTSDSGQVAYAGGFGGFDESIARISIATLVYSVARRKDLPQFKATLGYLTQRLENTANSYPEYSRYYQSQALFQGDVEAWEKWNKLLVRQLKTTQSEDGSIKGQFGPTIGTSLSLLALCAELPLSTHLRAMIMQPANVLIVGTARCSGQRGATDACHGHGGTSMWPCLSAPVHAHASVGMAPRPLACTVSGLVCLVAAVTFCLEATAVELKVVAVGVAAADPAANSKAQSDDAQAPAADPQAAVLHLKDRDFVAGELVDSQDPGQLVWKSPVFVEPLRFALAGVRAVQFPARAKPPKPEGDYCFDLAGGDVLFGTLVGLDRDTATIDVPGLGQLHVDRKIMRRMYRWNREDLIYSGPNGLEGWQVSASKGGWREDSGHLATEEIGAVVRRDFTAPASAHYEVELSWAKKPDFDLAFGVGNDPKSVLRAFRFEVWDNKLVAWRETEREADVSALAKIESGPGHVHLQALVDQDNGRMLVFSAAGEQLADLKVTTGKPQSFGGVQLTNKSGDIRLERLRISRWNGEAPRAVELDKARIHGPDGAATYGQLESYDATARQFVFNTDAGTQRLDENQVHDVFLSEAAGTPERALRRASIRLAQAASWKRSKSGRFGCARREFASQSYGRSPSCKGWLSLTPNPSSPKRKSPRLRPGKESWRFRAPDCTAISSKDVRVMLPLWSGNRGRASPAASWPPD